MENEDFELPIPLVDVLLGITPELAKYDELVGLHCEDGPAYIQRDTGAKLYFLHGIPVEPRVIEEPETLTVQEILAQPNIEVRHILIRKKGFGVFLKEAQAVMIDSDCESNNSNPRKLYKFEFPPIEIIEGVSLPDCDPLVVLHLVDSAKKRLGEPADVFFRVPPNMETCAQAVAWTFGVENPEDYRPSLEE